MNGNTSQRHRRCRQQGRQGLALAGLHFGEPTIEHYAAADDLHVIVTLADGPDAGLPHKREGVRDHVATQARLPQFRRHASDTLLQSLLAQSRVRILQRNDARGELPEPPDRQARRGDADPARDAQQPAISQILFDLCALDPGGNMQC